jgi:hypothetical protein
MFYRALDNGFYSPVIHSVIPPDAVEISDSLYFELLRGQESGKRIEPDRQGNPRLVDPPPLDAEELAAVERAWRDAQLALTDPLVSRHRDELEESGATSLTAEQYTELQVYRRQLRDWPQGEQFPLAEHRPPAPTWLAMETT